jgi:hypothetical protein
MKAPSTSRQAVLQRYACRSLLVSLCAVRLGLSVHRGSGWLLDQLEALARRQRRHASDLAVLGGLAPVPERLRNR